MAAPSATDVGDMRADVGGRLLVKRIWPLALLLLLAPPVTGRAPSSPAPITVWHDLTTLDVPGVVDREQALCLSELEASQAGKSVRCPAPVGSNPTVEPSPSPTASAIATHRPTATAASMSGHSITGIASWYRYVPGGAAAGPALRRALGPGWRGTVVTVCASRCIRVTLSDWCGCTTANEKLIDLDRASFALLADPSRGVVKVTVRWRTTP